MDKEDLLAVDKSSYIDDLDDFPYYIMDAYELPKDIDPGKQDLDKIVVCGMGGSGIPGDILKVYMRDKKIPVFPSKSYTLPAFVDKKTLVICISYSGNTEETIEAFRNALRLGAQIAVISSGGKMQELAEKHRKVFVKIPANHQPRAMVGYLFFSMLRLLVNYGLAPSCKKEVEDLSKYLKSPLFKKKGEDLATNLRGKIPLIYSSDEMYPVAMRFKTQVNENTKIHAFYNTFSEMNHNEIVGFTNLEGNKYHVVIFGSESDHPRIKKRFGIFKRLIKAKGVPITEMKFTGKSLLKQLFTAIYIGDCTSYFWAILNGTDPSPVDVIENLKADLKR